MELTNASPRSAPTQSEIDNDGKLTVKNQDANDEFQSIFRDPKEPVKIWIRYRIFSLSDIEGDDQTFNTRGLEEMLVFITEEDWKQWLKDPAQFKPGWIPYTFGYNAQSFDWNGTLRSTDGAQWMPPRYMKRAYRRKERVLERTRIFQATWNEPFELKLFPFDVQSLTMTFQIISSSASGEGMEVRLMGGHHFAKKFVAPQGEFEVMGRKAEDREYEEDKYFAEEILSPSKGQISLTVWVERCWWFYIHRVVFIFSIIIATSNLAVLFEDYVSQLDFLLTVLLTVVAYLFIVADYIPTVKYVTNMDLYVYGSAFHVLIMILEVTILKFYNDSNEEEITDTTKYGLLYANFATFLVMQLSLGFQFICSEDSVLREAYQERQEAKATLLGAYIAKPSRAWWNIKEGKELRRTRMKHAESNLGL